MIRQMGLFLTLLLFAPACQRDQATSNPRPVVIPGTTSQSSINISHALSLVDSIRIDEQMLAYIAIYADAPSYAPIVATGEGMTCVDDVGRFMEVLQVEIIQNGRRDLLPIARGMTRFLLHMTREDGLWFNFMFPDGSINREHQNSVADFGWWAIRGLRGLAAAMHIFQHEAKDMALLQEVDAAVRWTEPHIQQLVEVFEERLRDDGSQKLDWDLKKAPDRTAELLLALCSLQRTERFEFTEAIQAMGIALVIRQWNSPGHPLHGMYFCWQDKWHNWGNNQARALMTAFTLTGETRMLTSVQLWADHFVPSLLDWDFPWELQLTIDGVDRLADFPQIAYGINSIYQGVIALAEITGDEKYTALSEQVFAWFTGTNAANIAMYEASNGRCYDGINSKKDVNFNSGAESTIECLMAIQRHGGF